jgi:hypothetical protein
MRPEESTTPFRGGTRSAPDLDGRYGKIGISAVAAALRCLSECDPKEASVATDQPEPQQKG